MLRCAAEINVTTNLNSARFNIPFIFQIRSWKYLKKPDVFREAVDAFKLRGRLKGLDSESRVVRRRKIVGNSVARTKPAGWFTGRERRRSRLN